MTIVYPVGKGLYVNMTNRCPCACEFCIRKNGAGVYGSGPLWLEREPTAEEYVALCHPKFGLAAYEALLRFGAEVKAYVPSVTFTVVGTPEMTETRIAACRKVCDGVGVPLRVRTYSPTKQNERQED